MNVLVRGLQDVELTGNPEASLFRGIYKRASNFGMENVKIPFSVSGNARIPRVGDLLSRCYISIEDSSGNTVIPNTWAGLFDTVDLYIGDQLIDSQDFTYSSKIWPVLESNNTSQAVVPAGFYPLHFFFCNELKNALNLNAMKYHDVDIRLKSQASGYKFMLWGLFLYLSASDRELFPNEMRITQVQRLIYKNVNVFTSIIGNVKYIAVDYSTPVFTAADKTIQASQGANFSFPYTLDSIIWSAGTDSSALISTLPTGLSINSRTGQFTFAGGSPILKNQTIYIKATTTNGSSYTTSFNLTAIGIPLLATPTNQNLAAGPGSGTTYKIVQSTPIDSVTYTVSAPPVITYTSDATGITFKTRNYNTFSAQTITSVSATNIYGETSPVGPFTIASTFTIGTPTLSWDNSAGGLVVNATQFVLLNGYFYEFIVKTGGGGGVYLTTNKPALSASPINIPSNPPNWKAICSDGTRYIYGVCRDSGLKIYTFDIQNWGPTVTNTISHSYTITDIRQTAYFNGSIYFFSTGSGGGYLFKIDLTAGTLTRLDNTYINSQVNQGIVINAVTGVLYGSFTAIAGGTIYRYTPNAGSYNVAPLSWATNTAELWGLCLDETTDTIYTTNTSTPAIINSFKSGQSGRVQLVSMASISSSHQYIGVVFDNQNAILYVNDYSQSKIYMIN
jgi:hypothetical protein